MLKYIVEINEKKYGYESLTEAIQALITKKPSTQEIDVLIGDLLLEREGAKLYTTKVFKLFKQSLLDELEMIQKYHTEDFKGKCKYIHDSVILSLLYNLDSIKYPFSLFTGSNLSEVDRILKTALERVYGDIFLALKNTLGEIINDF
mgnify:CR=1 FL=1